MIKEIKYNRTVGEFKKLLDNTCVNEMTVLDFYDIINYKNYKNTSVYYIDSDDNSIRVYYNDLFCEGLTFGLDKYEVCRLICERHIYSMCYVMGADYDERIDLRL